MKKFDALCATAAALPMENVDTDKILPAEFLKTVTRRGLGKGLFWAMRQDPEFVLNREPWTHAGILIALDNFGCGSSREHAPWALADFGIQCIVAPSFADIFYNNCFKNGILPIVLPLLRVRALIALASNPGTARMYVDLAEQSLRAADGLTDHFDIDPKRKADLLVGADEIAKTLEYVTDIDAYDERRTTARPWIRDLDLHPA